MEVAAELCLELVFKEVQKKQLERSLCPWWHQHPLTLGHIPSRLDRPGVTRPCCTILRRMGIMMGAGLGPRGVPCMCQGSMCGQMPRHLGGGSKTHHLMPQDLWRGISLSFITS